jgi:hypothetical protein
VQVLAEKTRDKRLPIVVGGMMGLSAGGVKYERTAWQWWESASGPPEKRPCWFLFAVGWLQAFQSFITGA